MKHNLYLVQDQKYGTLYQPTELTTVIPSTFFKKNNGECCLCKMYVQNTGFLSVTSAHIFFNMWYVIYVNESTKAVIDRKWKEIDLC